MTAPLISICMPVLNTRRFLDDRMASILGQTCRDWELIVCDSYSNDGSWEYLQTFKSDARVRLYQVPREGIYAGWNECLKRVCGRYITIATSDDTAHPEFLERLVAALERYPDVRLAGCQFDCIDAEGRVLPHAFRERPNDCLGAWQDVPHRRSGLVEFLIHLICGGSWTTITSVMFRSDLLAEVGLFWEHETPVVDQLWAAKAALHTDTLWLPDRLATWRLHDAQGSSRGGRRMVWRQVELTARTVDECAPLLPARWKEDPAWRQKLTWGAWNFYRSCYGLNRRTLRHHPMQFMADAAWGLWHEPAYVARRVAQGLTWDAPEYEDSDAYVMRLIRDWGAPWPPEKLEM